MEGRGAFVVVCGPDAAGKTTLIQELERQWVDGRRVLVTEEPSPSVIGALIRGMLRRFPPADPATMALLFAADRSEHLLQQVIPTLAAGHDVLSSRYVESSLAYQGTHPDCSMDWVRAINRQFPKPDLMVVVDAPASVREERSLARGATSDGYDSDRSIQARVAAFYRRIEDHSLCDAVIRVDGTADPAETASAIRASLASLLRRPA